MSRGGVVGGLVSREKGGGASLFFGGERLVHTLTMLKDSKGKLMKTIFVSVTKN